VANSQKLHRLLLALALPMALISSGAPAAHAQIVGATLGGTVKDASGALLGGANVTVRQSELGPRVCSQPMPMAASTRRPFPSAFTPLPFPRRLRHSAANRHLACVGQSLELEFDLGVDTVHQDVVVDATVVSVNTTSQQTSGLIDERQVKELPSTAAATTNCSPSTRHSQLHQRAFRRIGSSNSSVATCSPSAAAAPDNLFLLNGIEYTGASLINVTPGAKR